MCPKSHLQKVSKIFWGSASDPLQHSYSLLWTLEDTPLLQTEIAADANVVIVVVVVAVAAAAATTTTLRLLQYR